MDDSVEAVGVDDGEASTVGCQGLVVHFAVIITDSAVGKKSK